MVSDDARYVVTVDLFAPPGSTQALIVEDQRAQAVHRFATAELLSADEIEERQEPGRIFRWSRGVLFDFSLDGTQLWLTLGPERRIVIDLATAAVVW
jgi:hypothetical protein